MPTTAMYDYDITTMRDDREFMFFNANAFTYESALQKAKTIKPTLGYGDDFIEPTDRHVESIWVKDNPLFADDSDEYAYVYSDPSDPKAYLVIGVELTYKNPILA